MHRSTAAPRLRRVAASSLAAVLILSLAGCARSADETTAPGSTHKPAEIVLASTTSTQDSGLFDVLIPAFEAASPAYRVKVVAVGTGEALKLGETKDADVLLVHSKVDEERFVRDGYGVERRDVMYNDFVVVGPASDPAGVKAAPDVAAALRAIRAAGSAGTAAFVSRGDDSGTHKKERVLWDEAGVTPPEPGSAGWYASSGQGMGETLRIASEKAAYTLADRATYLTMRDSLDLVIVREGDEGLRNEYGVIVVAGARQQEGARAFADWVVSAEAQALIGRFGAEEFGEPLFVPAAR